LGTSLLRTSNSNSEEQSRQVYSYKGMAEPSAWEFLDFRF
jgi:hypothetical protein